MELIPLSIVEKQIKRLPGTYHEYIIESKDSANIIFKKYFISELDLGDVEYPISIYNSQHDFYIARVNVFVKPNGKKNFKHLDYPNVYQCLY